jgi:Zn2+/Cd2+-exporting ATPase
LLSAIKNCKWHTGKKTIKEKYDENNFKKHGAVLPLLCGKNRKSTAFIRWSKHSKSPLQQWKDRGRSRSGSCIYPKTGSNSGISGLPGKSVTILIKELIMTGVNHYLHDTRLRRQSLVIMSGALILLGLGVHQLLGSWTFASGLYTVAAILAGSEIGARALTSLRNRHASIELLVTIAAVGALLIGDTWEAAAVTFLFILGAYLEARTMSQTRKVLGDLLDLAPVTATVIREGRQVETMPLEVKVGETVLLKPGSRVPVDGEVIKGASRVDESAITGEPMPEEKGEGDLVYAGTVNQNGLLHIRATGVGEDTSLARIIRRVEEAQEEKAPTQRFIERFARWYTPSIVVLSLVLFLVTFDIRLALTLLVISCPGALVISTPVSIVAGIGRAARSGILIKGGEYLENAGKISTVALDKTGTITMGKPRVTEVIPLVVHAIDMAGDHAMGSFYEANSLTATRTGIKEQTWDREQQQVLHWAIAAEAGSEHPLAKAILAEIESLNGNSPETQADSFKSFTGKGVEASYLGHQVLVGTPTFIHETGIEITPEAEEHLVRLKSSGKTAVLVALDEMVIGVIGISDPIRKTAKSMIRRLRERGVKHIVMLTGDDPLTAKAIAKEAGIEDVRAGLLPEDKLSAIRELQQAGNVVAMVGDGINDAPALAAADIGIAMGAAGTGVAIETADIALMSDDLMKIPEAIHLSKSTLRNIHQNVVIALVVVAALVAGVLTGKVHMAGGMLVHEVSVLVVILNGMRLLKVKRPA